MKSSVVSLTDPLLEYCSGVNSARGERCSMRKFFKPA